MPASISPREELIRIQKRIFKKNRKVIDESILVSEPGFVRYEQNYLTRVKNYQGVATPQDLTQALAKSQWIYVGDYHTNRQSQRAFLRILKMLITQTERFVICLEFIKKQHQSYVDQFLEDSISLKTFLKHINIKKNFYFDLWENFAPIFDFARYYHLAIYGIESAPAHAGLKKRDQEMAHTIAEISCLNPGYKIITFVGDLHIAPENLPRQTNKVLGSSYTDLGEELFIYQNSERIYWQLARDKLEHKVEVVKIDEKGYCLMNTSPIVWQQSYLNWLENEEGEIDHDDPKHNFLELAEQIARFLELDLSKEKDDVEVFTCGDLSFLERIKDDPDFTAHQRREITKQVELSESYYIPKRKWVYLANVSLNHAAEEASHFVRHLAAGDEFPRTSLDAFYANVLHEAMGFFGSKVINQKRKCLRLKDFQGMIEYFKNSRVPRHRSFDLEVAHAVLEIKKLEKKGRAIANPRNLFKKSIMFFALSHALGYMLGEMLFYAMIKEKFSKAQAKKLFQNPFADKGEPFQVYIDLIKRYGSIKLPYRI